MLYYRFHTFFTYIWHGFGKVDIRTREQWKYQATNVLRTSGLAVALLALAADLCKGLAAAWIGLAAGGAPWPPSVQQRLSPAIAIHYFEL